MDTSIRRLAIATLCAVPFMLMGCDEKPNSGRENPPFGINQNPNPYTVDSAQRVDATDEQNKSESRQTDQSKFEQNIATQDRNPIEPSKPLSLQKSISFKEDSSSLSDTAKEELDTLQSEIQKDKNQYLTIRIEDGDTIDATAPSKKVQELTADRTSAVIEHLKRQGVEFMGVAIDHTGEVSDYGEGNPMAKPDTVEKEESAEYVTLTIEIDDR